MVVNFFCTLTNQLFESFQYLFQITLFDSDLQENTVSSQALTSMEQSSINDAAEVDWEGRAKMMLYIIIGLVTLIVCLLLIGLYVYCKQKKNTHEENLIAKQEIAENVALNKVELGNKQKATNSILFV